MSLAKARERLIERGLLQRQGKGFAVTEAGEAWTDEQMARLKQGRLADER